MGKFDIEFPASEPVRVTIPLTFEGDAKTDLINRVNEGGEFHLLAGATSEITFTRFESFGNVEFADFLFLSSNFGQSSQVAAAVPEPSGMISLLICTAMTVLYRRK